MDLFPADIFTEQTADPNTLANLGPLRRLAGIWQSSAGVDVNPKAAGPERRQYSERIELQPIDAQSNGPQLFYGLRYHTHIAFNPDGSWSYVLETMLRVRGRAEPFLHRDANTLVKIAEPTPNPLARLRTVNG